MSTLLSRLSVVDSNVWLALLSTEDKSHGVATEWFEGIDAGCAGMCRHVQLTLIRLLGNRTVMGSAALSAAQAWSRIQLMMDDERVEFLPEPDGIDSVMPTLFRYSVPTPALVNDAFLAAFAMASARCLVTLDRGFDQFRGLELEILGD